MTIHIKYHHQCPSCGIEYIPFDDDVPCPKCGEIETERYDLIPTATASARLNLSENGSYIPLAWVVLSHGDAVLSLIFRLLEDYRNRGSEGDFTVRTLDILKNHFDWEGQDYLIPYVHRIAVRVHQEIIDAEE